MRMLPMCTAKSETGLLTASRASQECLHECRVPDDCTYEEAQLVRDCLQNEPDERPSAKDLVNRLAGSTHRSGNMLMRGGGSFTGGHISGQLLADGRYAGALVRRILLNPSIQPYCGYIYGPHTTVLCLDDCCCCTDYHRHARPY